MEHQELKVEYRRFETLHFKTDQLPSLHRVLQISEIDDEAAAHWWLIEPGLVEDAKRCMGEGGPTNWLGVNFAEWSPTFSNRGSFRYVPQIWLKEGAEIWLRIMMERRLSILMRNTSL